MKKRNYFSDIEDRNENAFSVIADFEGNEEQLMDIEVDEILPVLPLRNMVLFPGVFMPVSVGRKSSLKLVREAEKKSSYIAVVCQKAADTEEPVLEDLHTIGTVAKIVRVLEMPDQTTTVILQGSKRIELKEIMEVAPYLKGRVTTLNEEIPAKDDKEFQALVEACKDLTVRYIKSSEMFPQDSAFAIKNINNPMFLVDFICTNLPLKKDEKIELLRIDALRARTYRLLEILNREVQLVIWLVRYLIISEGNVANGQIVEIPAVCGFKARYGDVGLGIQLSGDSAGETVQLYAVQAASGHGVRQQAEKIAHAAGRFQNVAGSKSHASNGLIHGADDRRAGVMGVQGRGTGRRIFGLAEQLFEFLIFLFPICILRVKRLRKTAPANVF